MLLLVFGALYLGECCYWLPLRAVVVREGRFRRPGGPLANERAGVVWLHPLPPAGRAFACEPWPFSVTPDGISSVVVAAHGLSFRPPHAGLALSWDADGVPAEVSTDGKAIYLDGRRLAGCASAGEAAELAAFLASVAGAARTDRARLIREHLGRALSRAEAESRIGEGLRCGMAPARAGSAVLGWSLLVLPPAYLFLGAGATFLALLVVLPVLMLVAVVLEFRAHGRLFPALRGERWLHALVAAIAPQHAARAGDLLARSVLGATHPAALAGAPELEAICRDAEHPLPGVGDPVALAFHAHFLLPALGEAGAGAGAGAGASPAPDGSSVAYCPRCHTRFAREGAACEACGGMAVVPFAGARD
ncbi:hypothetical protein BH23VER1_BH23VER1_31610 [soil metagenome]